MCKMYFKLIALLLPLSVSAFQCPQDHSVESAYRNAERAFLVYVLETRLESELQERLSKQYPGMNDENESVKIISAGYRVIEEFKGQKSFQPRLADMLGIGTGYVGLSPGLYYLVLLPKPSSDPLNGMQMVNICNTPFSHYRLNETEFQKSLDQIRSLSKSENAK